MTAQHGKKNEQSDSCIFSLLDSGVFSPVSLQFPPSWIGHIPFAAWLVKQIEPRKIVELGTHSGNSYFSFCQAVKDNKIEAKCFAVDTWCGDKQAGYYDEQVFESVKVHNELHYASFSSLIRTTFDQATAYFEDNSIDLLHIDGCHTYEAVKHDFETWLSKLTKDAVILLHDVNVIEDDFGVWKFWQEIRQQYPCTLTFDHSAGLGVIQLIPTPECARLKWFEAFKAHERIYKEYFAVTGARLTNSYALQKLKVDSGRHIHEQQKRIHEQEERQQHLAQCIAEREVEINHLEISLAEKVEDLTQTNLKLENILRKNQLLKTEIDKLLTSNSWKITTPLREGKVFFSRIFQLGRNFPHSRVKRFLAVIWRISHRKKIASDFDPRDYLLLNPDLRELQYDPFIHYLRHGRAEGRIARMPGIEINTPLDPHKQTVLVVSHEASRTGAPVLALNILTGLGEKYNTVGLLLRGGSMLNEFQHAANGIVIVPPLAAPEGVAAHLYRQISFKYVIVNSIESRAVLQQCAESRIPSLLLIHEFASYTRPETSFNHALFWADEVVFSTRLTYNNAVEEHPELCRRRVHILPQGRSVLFTKQATDENNEEIDALNTRPKEVLIIGAGTVDMRKGVDLFIEVAARVAALEKNLTHEPSCRFVWVGKGYAPKEDTAYSVYLADQIKRCGLNDRVSFAGELTDLDMAYRQADIFLLSSRLDPLPNVAIDAMFHSVPVLCFDNTTGIAEILQHDELTSLCVVPYLDSVTMAKAIHRLVRDTDLRRKVGVKCRDIAEKTFNMQRYIDNLDSLAERSIRVVRQRRQDEKEISASGLYRGDYSPRLEHRSLALEAQIFRYVRSWSIHLGLRKPCPGFHPGIYTQEHGLTIEHADPFADYIRAGKPSGPWNTPLIIPDTPGPDLLPDNEKTALHIHAFYPEMLPQILTRLEKNRIRPDLYLSVPSEQSRVEAEQFCCKYHGKTADICVVPNKGRDIGPFITCFRNKWSEYSYVGHLHTKKSLDTLDAQGADNWCKFLFENLLGDADTRMADRILATLESDPGLGMVFPDEPNICGWGENLPFARELARQMQVERLPDEFDFPVGTMFWAAVPALEPLLRLELSWDDYPEEPLPQDGTMLHALERLLPMAVQSAGYRISMTNVPGISR